MSASDKVVARVIAHLPVDERIEAMKIRYAAKTDVGMKRTHNEDYFSLIEDEQLFIVADGMGGHAMGEVASKMAPYQLRQASSCCDAGNE